MAEINALRCSCRYSWKFPVFIYLFLFNYSIAFALPQDIVVSTPQGQSLTIDLTTMLVGMTADSVAVPATTSGGGSSSQVTTLGGVIVTASVNYTPNAGFSGIDSFDYVVFNGVTEVGRATISVTVGDVLSSGESPENEIKDTLVEICLQTRSGELIDLCDAFSTATQSGDPAELQELLDALAPKDAAAQMTLANSIAAQQVSNIIKRLNALRQGVTGFSLGGLSFLGDSYHISGSELFSGGAASGDSGLSKNLGIFIGGHVREGSQDVTINEDGFSFGAQSLTGGIDYRGNMGVIGLSAGLSSSEMSLVDNGGNLDVEAYNLSFYFSWYPVKGLYLDLVFGNNTQDFDQERRIVFGTTDAIAFGQTNSKLRTVSLGGGYEAYLGDGHLITFTGRYDSINANVDAYDEQGTSVYNLSINQRELKRQTSNVGVQYSVPISTSSAVFIPVIDISWVHQFQGEADSISGTFQADPNQLLFEFYSDVPDQDYFRLALGLSILLPGGSTSFLQLDTTVAKDNYSEYGLSAGYRMEF